VNGKGIQDSRDLSRVIAEVPVGNEVVVKVIRDGSEKTFSIKIAERTEDREVQAMKGSAEQTALGMTVSSITPEIARHYGLSESEGVVVVAVDEESPAAEAEVEEGDLILEIDHKPVKTLDEYERLVNEVKTGQTVSLLVKRRNGLVALNLTK